MFKLVLAVSIAAIFALFQVGANHLFKESDSESSHFVRESQIRKLHNQDASLNIPFLDKISKYWYVGGGTEIRNAGSIRLTRAGGTDQYGLILSNGMGDNTIDNFETIVTLKISPKEGSNPRALMGDGVAVVVTAEKDFLRQDLTSSYARKQYEINSGGVMVGDTSMMGLPLNLPGMAVIIDTFKNQGRTSVAVPFLDVILNTSPKTQAYDLESDGARTTALKLNQGKIKLKKSIMQGDTTKLRLIYLESENFLKIDIQYAEEGDYWIELFQTHLKEPLPRNEETNQRYIGISALTGELSQTVDILSVETNEFHLKDKGDTSNDFAKEIELYFIQEYNEKIALEEDSEQRWKMSKSQPRYEVNGINEMPAKKEVHGKSQFLKNFIVFFIILTTLYLASVYVRVSMKHVISSKRYRSKSVGLLPH